MKITETATHPGSCSICGQSIYTGDVIVQSELGNTPIASHAKCDPDLSIGGASPPARVTLRTERGVRVSAEQQVGFLTRDVLPVLRAIASGYTYDPGSSDLDDEQRIHVSLTLGDYRRASRLKYELERA